MSWVDTTIWWHVYPLGLVGAPIRPTDPMRSVFEDTEHLATVAQPRLRKLVNWLDYLVEMGLNGLLLAPIFQSSSHGYDTLDHLEIDPRLGTEKDFTELIDQCKKRGIRLVLDGVFSHVGYFHPKLQHAFREGTETKTANLFDIDWETPGGPTPKVWEGHGGLVRLNHEHPVTERYVYEVMDYWLSKGIDGWRLDAAYSVSPHFWGKVIPKLKKCHPNSWFLGEMIHGDYTEFVKETKMDSLTQYWLWKATWSSLVDENLFELEWAVNQNNELLETFTPTTFIGNHDVTRIATKVGQQNAVTAAAILFTLPGIPTIYYGDEQGFTGKKTDTPTGDDAVRPALPDHPQELSRLGEPVLKAYKSLISIRRQNSWLVNARVETKELTNKRYKYGVKELCGEHELEVTLDLDASPRTVVSDRIGNILWTQTPDMN